MNDKFRTMLREAKIPASKLDKIFDDEASLGIVLVGPEGVALTPFRNKLAKLQQKYKTDYELKMLNASDDAKVKTAAGYIADFKKDGRTTVAFVVMYDPQVAQGDKEMEKADDDVLNAMTKAKPDYLVQEYDE